MSCESQRSTSASTVAFAGIDAFRATGGLARTPSVTPVVTPENAIGRRPSRSVATCRFDEREAPRTRLAPRDPPGLRSVIRRRPGAPFTPPGFPSTPSPGVSDDLHPDPVPPPAHARVRVVPSPAHLRLVDRPSPSLLSRARRSPSRSCSAVRPTPPPQTRRGWRSSATSTTAPTATRPTPSSAASARRSPPAARRWRSAPETRSSTSPTRASPRRSAAGTPISPSRRRVSAP